MKPLIPSRRHRSRGVAAPALSALLTLGACLAGRPLLGQAPSVAETISKAAAEYAAKNYTRSLELYSDALARGSTESTVPYNAACCAALSGKTGRAFALLHKSLDFGWMNLAHLDRDSDLASLRGDPRWGELRTAIQNALRQYELRWSGKAFRTRYAENLSMAEKAAGLSRLWSEVKFNFVNFHLVPELDWDAEYMACMRKVMQSKSTIEYYRLLEALVAKLRDGHTGVYLPPELARTHNALPPVRSAYVAGKVLISKVLDPSLRASGVARGQELVTIDKQPLAEYVAVHIRPYMSASTSHDLDRRCYETSLLRGRAGTSVALELRKADGTTFTRSVKRVAGGGMLARYFSRPLAFRMKRLEGNVAYVQLNSFSTDDAHKSFAKAFDDIAACDALILDLRQNGGGNSGVGRRILGYLTDKAIRGTNWYTLQYRPTFRAWKRQPLSKHGSAGGSYAPGPKHYKKPVVMLIGPRTFSAAEDMAAGFDMLGRGKLIGSATGGSTGQPLMFDLPGGGRARVCTKHDSYADGTEFVGVGIQPDIAVQQTVEDFRKNFDRSLEVARKTVLAMRK